jgi:hypothetical protein
MKTTNEFIRVKTAGSTGRPASQRTAAIPHLNFNEFGSDRRAVERRRGETREEIGGGDYERASAKLVGIGVALPTGSRRSHSTSCGNYRATQARLQEVEEFSPKGRANGATDALSG